MQTALMAVTDDWLQDAQNVPTMTTTGGNATLTHAITCSDVQMYTPSITYHYPSWGYPVYVPSPSRPIKLTLREVELLREAAQRDSRVQHILEKFTPLIEVAVTFEDH